MPTPDNPQPSPDGPIPAPLPKSKILRELIKKTGPSISQIFENAAIAQTKVEENLTAEASKPEADSETMSTASGHLNVAYQQFSNFNKTTASWALVLMALVVGMALYLLLTVFGISMEDAVDGAIDNLQKMKEDALDGEDGQAQETEVEQTPKGEETQPPQNQEEELSLKDEKELLQAPKEQEELALKVNRGSGQVNEPSIQGDAETQEPPTTAKPSANSTEAPIEDFQPSTTEPQPANPTATVPTPEPAAAPETATTPEPVAVPELANISEPATESEQVTTAPEPNIFIPEEEGAGLGHAFPRMNDHEESVAPESTVGEPEPTVTESVTASILAASQPTSTVAAPDHMAAEPEPAIFIPEEEGTGLGHVFLWMNKNDDESTGPEPTVEPMPAIFIPQEEGTGLGHVFPWTKQQLDESEQADETPSINSQSIADVAPLEIPSTIPPADEDEPKAGEYQPNDRVITGDEVKPTTDEMPSETESAAGPSQNGDSPPTGSAPQHDNESEPEDDDGEHEDGDGDSGDDEGESEDDDDDSPSIPQIRPKFQGPTKQSMMEKLATLNVEEQKKYLLSIYSTARHKIIELEEELCDEENTNEESAGTIKTLRDEVKSLNSDVECKDAAIKRIVNSTLQLQDEIDAWERKDKQAKGANTQYKALREENNGLRREVQKRNDRIDSLTSQLQWAKADLKTMQVNIPTAVAEGIAADENNVRAHVEKQRNKDWITYQTHEKARFKALAKIDELEKMIKAKSPDSAEVVDILNAKDEEIDRLETENRARVVTDARLKKMFQAYKTHYNDIAGKAREHVKLGSDMVRRLRTLDHVLMLDLTLVNPDDQADIFKRAEEHFGIDDGGEIVDSKEFPLIRESVEVLLSSIMGQEIKDAMAGNESEVDEDEDPNRLDTDDEGDSEVVSDGELEDSDVEELDETEKQPEETAGQTTEQPTEQASQEQVDEEDPVSDAKGTAKEGEAATEKGNQAPSHHNEAEADVDDEAGADADVEDNAGADTEVEAGADIEDQDEVQIRYDAEPAPEPPTEGVWFTTDESDIPVCVPEKEVHDLATPDDCQRPTFKDHEVTELEGDEYDAEGEKPKNQVDITPGEVDTIPPQDVDEEEIDDAGLDNNDAGSGDNTHEDVNEDGEATEHEGGGTDDIKAGKTQEETKAATIPSAEDLSDKDDEKTTTSTTQSPDPDRSTQPTTAASTPEPHTNNNSNSNALATPSKIPLPSTPQPPDSPPTPSKKPVVQPPTITATASAVAVAQPETWETSTSAPAAPPKPKKKNNRKKLTAAQRTQKRKEMRVKAKVRGRE